MSTTAEQEDIEEQRKKKEEEGRKKELNDCEVLLGSDSFCRFFQRMMSDSRFMSTTFTGNSHGMFLEGRRDLVLRFFGDLLEADKDKAVKLLILEEVE